jgi:PAS domain S-box-containing protein
VLVLTAEPSSVGRIALAGSAALGLLTLPLGRLAAHISRNHPSVYWWSGHVWASAVPLLFGMTVGDAFDGTGPAFSKRACTPFVITALVGNGFAVGAQGALLAVPRDVVINMASMIIGTIAIKLKVAYTPAYLLVHVVGLGALWLGYVCVAKYADVHEAMHEAAEAVVVGAAAREPFVVTDHVLNVRAVNQRLLDVLGYEEHELVGRPVMELLDEASYGGSDHAWIRRTLFESASRRECPNDYVWSLLTKKGQAHPVRITLGETRCPISATRMFTAQFSCMRLEQRNAQLVCEKEKLQWEVASHHDDDWEDPREALGASCHGTDNHRTLGAMQDQATTDDAISCARSFDHVASSVESPTVPGHTLIAPAPPRTMSPITTSSIVSCKSSVMDTVSEAAKKSPTRAPPPPKARPSRPKKTCSEPSSAPKPKAGNPTTPQRALPHVECDLRECS